MAKNGDNTADAVLVKPGDREIHNTKPEQEKPNFDQYIIAKPDKPIDGIDKHFDLSSLQPKVSDEDRKKAAEAVDSKVGGLVSPADREALKSITDGVMSGDLSKFSQAVAAAGKDPEKLKALVEEANKNLKESGSSTSLSVNSEGKVIVHSADSDKAVEIDPATGKSKVVKIEHDPDGGILVKPGEYIGRSAKDVFKELGDDAVNGVLGRNMNIDFGSLGKGEPKWPHQPFDPMEPFEPHKPFKPITEDPFKPGDPIWNKPGKRPYDPLIDGRIGDKPWMLDMGIEHNAGKTLNLGDIWK